MKLIALTQGQFAMVDDADYELVNQYKWFAYRRGKCWYARRNVRRQDGTRTGTTMRTFLMGTTSGEIDHKDRNGLNNQRSNLRFCTQRQNARNRVWGKPKGRSRYRGVFPIRRKWKVQIGLDRQLYHVGVYDTEEAAARAYDVAAIRFHGEFAVLNFPACMDAIIADCESDTRVQGGAL